MKPRYASTQARRCHRTPGLGYDRSPGILVDTILHRLVADRVDRSSDTNNLRLEANLFERDIERQCASHHHLKVIWANRYGFQELLTHPGAVDPRPPQGCPYGRAFRLGLDRAWPFLPIVPTYGTYVTPG
jgi:hypothetical protein